MTEVPGDPPGTGGESICHFFFVNDI